MLSLTPSRGTPSSPFGHYRHLPARSRAMAAGCEADLGDDMETAGLEIVYGGGRCAEDAGSKCLQLRRPEDAAFVVNEG